MTNKEKIIKHIRRNIEQLSISPEYAATVKALRKQLASMRSCIYAEKTAQKVKCGTCGNAEYIYCQKKRLRINSNLCNPQNCKYCKIQDATTLNLKTRERL